MDFCHRENIHLLAYNPLVKGIYVKKHKEGNVNLLEEPIIKEIGKKYNKTPGQIVLNWSFSLGVIPVPGTSNIKKAQRKLG